MSVGFKTKLKIELSHKKKNVKWYRLKDDLVYQDEYYCYIICKGYLTDLASVPYPLSKWIKPNNKLYARASVLHDYCYTKQIGKVKSDKLYYRAMKNDNVPLRYRVPFFLAVFIFGGKYYERL